MAELEDLLDWLEKISKSNVLVIAEGVKDKRALAKFGIKRVKTLSKRAIYRVVEEVVETDSNVIILTDLDKEGKRLFKLLNHPLCQHGVHVDKKFREFLFKETKLRQIEGLKTYINNLKSTGHRQ